MREYAPRDITARDIASGNLFAAIRPESVPTQGDVDTNVTARYITQAPSEDYITEYQRLVSHYRLQGIPESRLARMASDAMSRRKATTTHTVKVYADMDADHESFTATYGKGASWKPNHDRHRVDCDDAPFRIIQTRLG